jgi:hypothetical protein
MRQHTRSNPMSARSRRHTSALVDGYIRELSRRRQRRAVNIGPQSGHYYMPEAPDPLPC